MIASPTTEKMFKDASVLGTFSAKIDLAYSAGWIPEEMHRDLHLIRKVRNDFAHSLNHELDFTTPSVVDRVNELCAPTLATPEDEWTREVRINADVPGGQTRLRLFVATGILFELLWYRTMISSDEPKALPLRHGMSDDGGFDLTAY